MISNDDWLEAHRLCAISDVSAETAQEAKRLLALLLEEHKRATDVEAKLIRFGKAVGVKRIEELENQVEQLEQNMDKLCLALARYGRSA